MGVDRWKTRGAVMVADTLSGLLSSVPHTAQAPESATQVRLQCKLKKKSAKEKVDSIAPPITRQREHKQREPVRAAANCAPQAMAVTRCDNDSFCGVKTRSHSSVACNMEEKFVPQPYNSPSSAKRQPVPTTSILLIAHGPVTAKLLNLPQPVICTIFARDSTCMSCGVLISSYAELAGVPSWPKHEQPHAYRLEGWVVRERFRDG